MQATTSAETTMPETASAETTMPETTMPTISTTAFFDVTTSDLHDVTRSTSLVTTIHSTPIVTPMPMDTLCRGNNFF